MLSDQSSSVSLKERSDLVLTFARVLHVNGQSTDETVAAAERLGHKLDLRARIIPRWGELQLQAEDGDARLICAAAADPTGVDMDRVVSTMRAIDELGAGRLAPAAAMKAISAISQAPPVTSKHVAARTDTRVIAVARLQFSSSSRRRCPATVANKPVSLSRLGKGCGGRSASLVGSRR